MISSWCTLHPLGHPQFDEAHEIIARHDTLRQTREDLLEREHRNQDAIETERASLKKYMEVTDRPWGTVFV